VLCGGEDEPFSDQASRDALMAEKTRLLEARLADLFPALDPSAEYSWCGTFGLSELGLPSIGAVPGMPNCYAVLGYGGNGITFSALAAQLLRNQIAGGGDPDADLFAF
jgi:glycine/D-amino acid oxidase-like deaminating enzyme